MDMCTGRGRSDDKYTTIRQLYQTRLQVLVRRYKYSGDVRLKVITSTPR